MEKNIGATEAVRRFSEILNTIRFRGEHYIIQRGGRPVAFMGPAEEAHKERLMGEFGTIFKNLPRLGKEAGAFEKDMKEVVAHQPALSEGERWE